MRTHLSLTGSAAACALLLAGCGGGDDPAPLPQLSAATGATLSSCADLGARFTAAGLTITSAAAQAAGALTVAGTPIAAHCLVRGELNRRTSPQDGQTYAINFEMRLPNAWNGRFFHQGNGGTDGAVSQAVGAFGGGPLTNALHQGFAVISSDAGHNGAQNANGAFGVDAQARLDYGYQAAMKLTPIAKGLIAAAYGKGPDRSYFGGCSNGGRHTFVAMTRMPEQYDGYLAGAPGYRLPLAAIANIYGAKRYATVVDSGANAATQAGLSTAFTAAERATVAAAVVAKCDALDGASDGLVQDTTACQAAFNLNTDVATCGGGTTTNCLSAAKKTAIAPIFSGAVDGQGRKFYASFPYDSGLGSGGIPFWEFGASLNLDTGGVGVIWGVPPANPATFNGPNLALNGLIDDMLAAVQATNATYTESALSFMQPVNPTNLATLKNRGAKVLVYHGVSDPIFSVDDTAVWYDGLRAANGGDASNFARFFRVPGMGHCSGGPATDQFDALTPLVNWVEKGEAPASLVATARGAGNAGGVNAEVPAGWAANRSRPLCPYPQVARLRTGATNLESADSFSCQ
ncbi:tannase/feruloyl esterase family alpha/beta hydrolase [Aquabacterium sp. J223]|uniref:tannase/feruloyl esterase family alpha/beta hydrolase n=1 Tax=Aquabacterium sp. J223 TaxID=2898431 RepID=UPI0021ADC31D|nr:tannase/feruloyl esterase family alpha/beta hydrolase [Aquabacterium sp. J223]UUX97262.1 tannase/feruloyl esterase family alpha/beta hydrolase [Aquabacterium sp. J223]